MARISAVVVNGMRTACHGARLRKQGEGQRQEHQGTDAGNLRQTLGQCLLKPDDIENDQNRQQAEHKEQGSGAASMIAEAAAAQEGSVLLAEQQQLGLGDGLAARYEFGAGLVVIEHGRFVVPHRLAVALLAPVGRQVLQGFLTFPISLCLVDDGESDPGTNLIAEGLAGTEGKDGTDRPAQSRSPPAR